VEGRATSHVKWAEIDAVVIRADGRVEHLGAIAYYHRNPLRRLWWVIKGLLGLRRGG
jgi:hypothetical protein